MSEQSSKTYRERREAKAERLREWAEKREAKAVASFETAERIGRMIPLGQPVLMGHHSQGRHLRDLDRIDNRTRKGIEHNNKAAEMRNRAANIEAAADNAIYSDDPDVIERLTEKLAAMEAKRDQMKAANAAFRKSHKAELKALGSAYQRNRALPHPSYELTNLGGNISRARKRLASMT